MGISVSSSDQAGQLYAQGLSNFGEGLAKGIQQGRENKRMLDFMSGRMSSLSQEISIPVDVLDKFQTGSLGQKQGIVMGLEAQAEEARMTKRQQAMDASALERIAATGRMNLETSSAAAERARVEELMGMQKAADELGSAAHQMGKSGAITKGQVDQVLALRQNPKMAWEQLERFVTQNQAASPDRFKTGQVNGQDVTIDTMTGDVLERYMGGGGNGAGRFVQQPLPDGSTVTIDTLTNRPVPTSQLQKAPEADGLSGLIESVRGQSGNAAVPPEKKKAPVADNVDILYAD